MLEQMMILHDCEDLVEVQKFKKTHRLKDSLGTGELMMNKTKRLASM